MIAPAKVQEIERLLAAGMLSQRRIARLAGVSRATVSGIARGTRPDYDALRVARQQLRSAPLGPLARCGECGGLVYAPCRLCRVRRLKAAGLAKLGVARGLGRHDSGGERCSTAGRTGGALQAPDPRKAG